MIYNNSNNNNNNNNINNNYNNDYNNDIAYSSNNNDDSGSGSGSGIGNVNRNGNGGGANESESAILIQSYCRDDIEADSGYIENDEQPIILHIKSENKIETQTTTTIGGEIYNDIDIDGGNSDEQPKLKTNYSLFEKLILFFKSINKHKKRILVGFLAINIGFPLYLAYNTPSSMVKIFDEHYNMDATQYSRLYSVYAIPNIILVFLGGILVDLIGVNKCSIICSSLLTISIIISAISSTPANYELLLFSRILLGVGGETMIVCMASYITKFFEQSNQSLLFGLEGMWLQIGSLLAFSVLPTLYENTSFAFSLWSIAALGIFCTFLNIIFIIFQEKLKFIKEDENIELIPNDNYPIDNEETNNGADQPSTLITKGEEDGMMMMMMDKINESKLIILKENIKQALILVKTMPSRVWILCFVAFFGYSGFFGMDIIFTDMAIEKYGYSDRGAAIIMAFETLFTSFSSPLFGYFVRKLQRNILSMGIGLLMMLIGMILIVSTSSNVNPIAFVILCGMGYIFMSNAIYSSIPLLVDPSSQGTAFGLIGTSYNIGIVIFPYILSSIRISTGSYEISFWLLALSTFIGLIGLLFLKYLDSKNEINHSNRLDRAHYNFINKILKVNQ
ncbi:hypothetical protein RB653_004694 [Dictyostelium firmibasis]|uniref:Lysosomal dipeptide transporter MFSD1 n=1 Tax=Dictyostelium firmibasis TaxID=79012 RepID=A0AAN7U004_9MYCE